MKDIINSFKAHLYERTTSPFIGAFVFYWIICNYKLTMIIIDGDMKTNEKFDLIKTIYPQNILTLWEGFDIHYSTLSGNGLLIPLIITLLYIFIIPYPAKFIYEFWKNKQKEIQEIKQKIEDETPLTKEQSKKICQDISKLEFEYDNSLTRKNDEINQLKEMIKEKDIPFINKKDLEEDIQIKKDNNYEKLSEMNNQDIKDFDNILFFIGENDGTVTDTELKKHFNSLKSIKIKYFIDTLTMYKLIRISAYAKYFIQSEGTKYLYSKSLI